jgi:prophage maintenance system killer protein
VALGQFLADNGLQLEAEPDDATGMILQVAAGKVGIPELTAWLRPRVIESPS